MSSEIENYDFPLPNELIAQFPRPQRVDARLLVANRDENSIDHHHIRDLPNLLRAGDCLVFNNSKVILARLVGKREGTGGGWEGLFLRESDGVWQILCKTRGRLKPNEWIVLEDRSARKELRLQMVAKYDDGSWAVRPESDDSWVDLLDRIGRVPLPHYIRKGQMVDSDLKNYQTFFAAEPGSVAAPTAGLHFTEGLLRRLSERGILHAFVKLHVGVGTFRPVTADSLDGHKMHAEFGSISDATVAKLQSVRAEGGRIVAVGTTSVRVLESASAGGKLQSWTGETDLFIRPPYQFKSVDALITNFHLPRSTLIVLVRCFGGDELMKRAYSEAIEERYRFFSYGDAMIIE